MRKKIVMLSLALGALTGAFLSTPQAQAFGGVCQTICTYYPDGSRCCVPCSGKFPNCVCADVYCPPAVGIN